MEVFLFFTIRHAIQYQYRSAVFLEPLTLRLRPRSDVFQRLVSFDLAILPRPAGRSDGVDLEGNSITSLWFDGTCSQLSILATSRVETLCTNPFRFIITDQSASKVPAGYQDETKSLLEPYLHRIDPCEALDEFAADALRETDGQTVSFLSALTGLIAGRFEKIVRMTGSPRRPSVTLEQGRGACRDLAVLFMDLCRSVGLASRFVSGYTEADQSGVQRELHAWAEVYLPGGGWRGFDPTLGLAVADRHVVAAASPVPEGASPMAGTFRGDAAGSMMNYEVSVVADIEKPGEDDQ
jgi:transglutaminase-like putative cysteine protease